MLTAANSDWAATFAIYTFESVDPPISVLSSLEQDESIPGSLTKNEESWQGVLHLTIQVRDTVFIQGPVHHHHHHHTATNKKKPPDAKYKHLIPTTTHTKSKKRRFRNKIYDPVFHYKVLSEEEDAPKVRVAFQYKHAKEDSPENNNYDESWEEEDTTGPISVCVTPVYFPDIWEEFLPNWISWLNREATKVLIEEESSFAVCQWIEFKALEFFDVFWKNEQEPEPVSMAVALLSQDREDDNNLYENEITNEELTSVWRLSDQSNKGNAANSRQTASISSGRNAYLDTAARKFITYHWKEWMTVECPICFDVIPVSQAKEIFPCRHYYCCDCISTYAKMIVPDLRIQRQNPFTCPIPACQRQIKIVQCVKALLTREEMDLVREWYKNVTQPVSNMLQMCPRKKCGIRDKMRRVSMDSTIVRCEGCGVQWCELCLAKVSPGKRGSNNKKYKDNDGPQHDAANCNPSQVLDLCHRYRSTKSERIKARCEEKWPWIREYAIARIEDVEAMQWIRENGCTMCPACNAVIERSEGCFHMKCAQCATHFCYECGDKLFPPYYGTHHCWEQNNLDQFDD